MSDPLDGIPTLPDGIEGVLLRRMDPDFEAEPVDCADCGRRVPRGEHVVGDRTGIYCNRCR